MQRRFTWQILGLALALTLALTTWSVKASDMPTPSAQAPTKATAQVDDLRETYPVMRPDHETLMRWIQDFESAPEAHIDYDLSMGMAPQGSDSPQPSENYTFQQAHKRYTPRPIDKSINGSKPVQPPFCNINQTEGEPNNTHHR